MREERHAGASRWEERSRGRRPRGEEKLAGFGRERRGRSGRRRRRRSGVLAPPFPTYLDPHRFCCCCQCTTGCSQARGASTACWPARSAATFGGRRSATAMGETVAAGRREGGDHWLGPQPPLHHASTSTGAREAAVAQNDAGARLAALPPWSSMQFAADSYPRARRCGHRMAKHALRDALGLPRRTEPHAAEATRGGRLDGEAETVFFFFFSVAARHFEFWSLVMVGAGAEATLLACWPSCLSCTTSSPINP